MGVTGDASVLLARYKQRLNLSKNFVGIAEKQTMADALASAIKLSYGPLSYATLRRMGYPYATRNPTSPNPEVINVHDGSVVGGWSAQMFGTSAFGTTVALKNSSPWIVYLLGGTSKMILRPIDKAINLAVGKQRLSRLSIGKSKALD